MATKFSPFELVALDRLPGRQEHCPVHGDYVSRNYLGNIWSRCPVCAREEAEAERKEKEIESRRRATEAWMARMGESGIPPRFLRCEFDNFVPMDGKRRSLDMARKYVADFDQVMTSGRSMIIVGSPGVGKTHLACAIGLHLLRAGRRVVYTTILKMFRRLRGTWQRGAGEKTENVISVYTSADLLILDEVGVQLGSDYERVEVFGVINERYENLRPTIIISNLDRDGTRDYLGDRVWDRLRENNGVFIALQGKSMRGVQLNDGGSCATG
jgi:DNA replication protein DnaC